MQADAPRRAIKVEKPSVWESVRLFLNARETRMVCGIVLHIASANIKLICIVLLLTAIGGKWILPIVRRISAIASST